MTPEQADLGVLVGMILVAISWVGILGTILEWQEQRKKGKKP